MSVLLICALLALSAMSQTGPVRSARLLLACDSAQDCSGNGSTTDGDDSDGCVCTCDAGFGGSDCSIQLYDLPPWIQRLYTSYGVLSFQSELKHDGSQYYVGTKPTCIAYGTAWSTTDGCDPNTYVCCGKQNSFGFPKLQYYQLLHLMATEYSHPQCPKTLAAATGKLMTLSSNMPNWLIDHIDENKRNDMSHDGNEWYLNGEPTCVAFGNGDWVVDNCDTGRYVCSGSSGLSVGYPTEQNAKLNAVSAGNERHPDCPYVEYKAIPMWLLTRFVNAGLTTVETDGKEFYIDKKATCIAYGSSNWITADQCDNTKYFCSGTYIDMDDPTYATMFGYPAHMVNALQNVDSTTKVHPHCSD